MAAIAIVLVFCLAWVAFVALMMVLGNGFDPFARWIGGGVGVFVASNVAEGVEKDKRPKGIWDWSIFDPVDLVNGHRWGPVPVLLYRTVVLQVFVASMLCEGVWHSISLNPHWLTYFTNWTFIAMGLYGFLGVILGLQALFSKGKPKWGLLERTFAITYMIASTCGIFVTCFYWFFLHEGAVTSSLVMRHGVNAALLIGELFISRVPIRSDYVMFPLSYLGVYGVFFWTYYWFTDEWVYNVLRGDRLLAIAFYVLLPFVVLTSYYIIFTFAVFRERMLKKPVPETPQKPLVEV